MKNDNIAINKNMMIDSDSELIYASSVGVGADNEEVRLILFNKRLTSDGENIEIINRIKHPNNIKQTTSIQIKRIIGWTLKIILGGYRGFKSNKERHSLFSYLEIITGKTVTFQNLIFAINYPNILVKKINKELGQLYKDELIRYKNTNHGKDFLNIHKKSQIESEIKDKLNQLYNWKW